MKKASFVKSVASSSNTNNNTTKLNPQSLFTNGTDKHALRQSIRSLVAKDASDGDPFFVVDLGDVFRKYQKWLRMMPRVEPFYAVKCCPDTKILEALASLGVNFDCASKGEIEQIIQLGVDPSRIIFAHPAKAIGHLKYAREVGVELMTFDNEFELTKIKTHYPKAKLVLRILADDPKALCPLGNKFGAYPDTTLNLLNIAKTLNLDVVGVSFHVGSGCQNAEAYDFAIASARRVFDEAKAVGFAFNILDIGGGFPGVDSAAVSFRDIANVVSRSVDRYFPADYVDSFTHNFRIIAEPGRYFVTSACTLVLNVIAKKAAAKPTTESNDTTSFMYYVNDGVYGALNCCMYDHAAITVIKTLKDKEENLLHCSIWGPTCDGIDYITKDTLLPELEIGDWLYIEDMGAYTLAAGSNFNGFVSAVRFYTFSVPEKFDASILPESFPNIIACNNVTTSVF